MQIFHIHRRSPFKSRQIPWQPDNIQVYRWLLPWILFAVEFRDLEILFLSIIYCPFSSVFGDNTKSSWSLFPLQLVCVYRSGSRGKVTANQAWIPEILTQRPGVLQQNGQYCVVTELIPGITALQIHPLKWQEEVHYKHPMTWLLTKSKLQQIITCKRTTLQRN